MRFQRAILGFLAVVTCSAVGYAQYDIVSGSTREEQITLSNGDSARKQTFQISPKRVVRYKNFVAEVIRDDHTGVFGFTFEGADNIETTQPAGTWIVVKSKDGRSLAGFRVSLSKLIYRASNRTAGSIDSARALAMTELSAEIAGWESNLVRFPEIELNPHLDVALFSGALGMRPSDLRQVTATDDGWLLELSSHPSVAKTALVYLSQDFKVLKVDVRKT